MLPSHMKVLLMIFFIVSQLFAFSNINIRKQILFFSKFDKFLTWTKEQQEKKRFVIGLLGYVSFADRLEEYYAERKISARPVSVRKITSLDEIQKCHIVFISESQYTLEDVLDAAKGKGVLLISHKDGWGEKGVHLNYYTQGGNLKFELNPYTSKRDGIHFKTVLLRAMKTVGKIVQ